MNNEPSHDYLISTFFDFGSREIEVVVTNDGVSHWTDYTAINALNRERPGYILSTSPVLFPGAFDQNARKHLAELVAENTVEVPVPEAALRQIREELSPVYWNDVESADDAALDALLEPLFWEHVAPFLSPPLTRHGG